jgi:hypothetical protein
VIDLSAVKNVDAGPPMIYFASSSLSGAFEMIRSFIENSNVIEGNVQLSK